MLGRVVGISGFARSGKDTVGEYLVERYGYQRIAFADKVREVAQAFDFSIFLDGIGEISMSDIYSDETLANLRKSEEVRANLVFVAQTLRDVIGQNIWAEPVIQQIRRRPYQRFVITDVRQENEANLLRHNFDTTIISVRRPGVIGAEPIEASTIPGIVCDYTIDNNGSQEKLHKAIDALMIKGYY